MQRAGLSGRSLHWIVLLMLLVASTGRTESTGEGPFMLTLERVLSQPALDGGLPRPSMWRPGGATWLYVRQDPGGVQELVEVDPVGLDSCVLIDSVALADALATAARPVQDAESEAAGGDAARDDDAPVAVRLHSAMLAPDGATMLLAHGDDLVLIDLATTDVELLGTGEGEEEHVSFDPTGKRLAYVRDNDLFVYDLAGRAEVRLTDDGDDGGDAVTNGTFDWIYWEELADRSGKAYAWAPDGSAVLWIHLDDREIPAFHLVDVMSTHSRVETQWYPKPGDPAPVASLMLARLGPGSQVVSTSVIVPEEPSDYLPRFGFFPDGRSVWYQRLDHQQSRLELRQHDLSDGSERTRLVEEDPYWVEPVDMMKVLGDGSVLWASRRSGFMHLLLVPEDGEPRDLTPGPGDVTDLVGVDEDQRSAWIEAARPDHRQRNLFRVGLDDGTMIQLTSGRGTFTGQLSPGAEWLAVRSSSAERPPRLDLRTAAEGFEVGALVEPERPELARLELGTHRFYSIPADDGVRLDLSLLMPRQLEPGHRYPVVITTYGGPHVQMVRDAWSRGEIFNQWLLQQGVLVAAVDNRGASCRGREFEGAIDHALGSGQLPDVLAAVQWLSDQPFVKPDRIGIWGWSYGGYMTAYALTHAPGVFAAGVAVAPVTDWRLYDSVYTERYMGTPADDPEAYDRGSVLEAVGRLEDPLLVIHGTADDNVHLQHTLQLADRAWRAGVRFDLMLFPGLRHGIYGPGSHLQVYSRLTDHLLGHLLDETPSSPESR